jgi:hypothetical protein
LCITSNYYKNIKRFLEERKMEKTTIELTKDEIENIHNVLVLARIVTQGSKHYGSFEQSVIEAQNSLDIYAR